MSMTITGMANDQMRDTMTKLSAMKKITSAADDAAGLAISEKMQSQIGGLAQGIANTQDMQNLVKTAEGGLATIDENLQRVRELSVQAANGIYTDEDRALLQGEIAQLTENISNVAQSTQFNNMNLLDGSFTHKQTASAPDGSGATISIPDVSTLALGLQNYDVTGSFDISQVDNAISAVSNVRSSLGATANALDNTISANSITMLNQAAAKSRIVDLDVAKASTAFNREKIMQEYQIHNTKNQMEQQKNAWSVLF